MAHNYFKTCYCTRVLQHKLLIIILGNCCLIIAKPFLYILLETRIIGMIMSALCIHVSSNLEYPCNVNREYSSNWIYTLLPSVVEISFSDESVGSLSFLFSSLFRSILKAPLKAGLEK